MAYRYMPPFVCWGAGWGRACTESILNILIKLVQFHN